MNNLEKLQELISKLAEDHISNDDSILAFLASIATSLAVIADNMEENK